MALWAALSPASAQIFDNLADPINSLQQAENGSGGSVGNRFVTGPTTTQLTSVSLDMRHVSENGGNFTVSLWSDAGGGHAPGALLGVLFGNPDPITDGVFTYTPTNEILLAPSESYWVVAGVSSGPAVFVWNETTSSAFTGTGTGGGRLRGDYQNPALFVAPEFPSSSGTLMFQVDATPVPEPRDVAAMTAAGLLAVALLRRRFGT